MSSLCWSRTRGFASSIAATPVNVLTIPYAVAAVILGIIGALLAIFSGISFQIFGRIMDRCVQRPVHRTRLWRLE